MDLYVWHIWCPTVNGKLHFNMEILNSDMFFAWQIEQRVMIFEVIYESENSNQNAHFSCMNCCQELMMHSPNVSKKSSHLIELVLSLLIWLLQLGYGPKFRCHSHVYSFNRFALSTKNYDKVRFTKHFLAKSENNYKRRWVQLTEHFLQKSLAKILSSENKLNFSFEKQLIKTDLFSCVYCLLATKFFICNL